MPRATRWEELTYEELKKLAEEGAVAIIPLGSLEVHGPHLPLGTDYMVAHRVALEVAKREKAVVLPPIAYAYVPENRHFAGAVTLSGDTLTRLLEEVCDEVYRNGFKRILVLNGHGGNARVLRLFVREMMRKRKRYLLYVLTDPLAPIAAVIDRVRETDVYGHAGEIETSIVLYVRPDLVKLERVRGGARLGPRRVLEHVDAMADWVCYALEGFVGDPTKASADKGRVLFEALVEAVAEIVRRIREDREYERVMAEYYARAYPSGEG